MTTRVWESRSRGLRAVAASLQEQAQCDETVHITEAGEPAVTEDTSRFRTAHPSIAYVPGALCVVCDVCMVVCKVADAGCVCCGACALIDVAQWKRADRPVRYSALNAGPPGLLQRTNPSARVGFRKATRMQTICSQQAR